MGIFNSKSDNDAFSPQDLKELFQRLEHLERKCRRLDARIAELEDEFASQRNRAASAKMDTSLVSTKTVTANATYLRAIAVLPLCGAISATCATGCVITA